MAAELRTSLEKAIASATPGDLPAMLSDLGWDEVVNDDEAGATILLFEAQGLALTTSTLLDHEVHRALDLPVDRQVRVCYPYGVEAAVPLPDTRVSAPDRPHLVLGSVGPGEVVLVTGPASVCLARLTSSARLERVEGIDVEAGWWRVRDELEIVDELAAGPSADMAIERAWAAARRALASELVGTTRTALRLATEHVTTREQFGRPIGSFQSVRHRLAEAYAWLAGSEALIAGAWQDRSAHCALAAKAYAGLTHERVVRHALQVCGAMGQTHEHPLHRSVRRGFILDHLLGGSRAASEARGRALLDGEPPLNLTARNTQPLEELGVDEKGSDCGHSRH